MKKVCQGCHIIFDSKDEYDYSSLIAYGNIFVKGHYCKSCGKRITQCILDMLEGDYEEVIQIFSG